MLNSEDLSKWKGFFNKPEKETFFFKKKSNKLEKQQKPPWYDWINSSGKLSVFFVNGEKVFCFPLLLTESLHEPLVSAFEDDFGANICWWTEALKYKLTYIKRAKIMKVISY